MNVGLVIMALGALLLLLHASVLPAIDRSVSRRRPESRFASEAYVAWRGQHRRAGLAGAVGVMVLGMLVLLLL